MIQKWSRYLILECFFDQPRKAFLVRELSRRTRLAPPSIRLHLKALLSEGLIQKEEEGLYPAFKAQTQNPLYKLLKQQNLVLRLHQTGLIEHLEKTLYPTCIVLYGSGCRGEDTEESDTDLFLQAHPTLLDLRSFEKKLCRKIQLLFEPDLKNLSPELLNNLANGTVLYGYLKVL